MVLHLLRAAKGRLSQMTRRQPPNFLHGEYLISRSGMVMSLSFSFRFLDLRLFGTNTTSTDILLCWKVVMGG